MNTNKKADTINTIGIAIIILGMIGSFILGGVIPAITYDYSYFSGYDIEEMYNWGLAVGGAMGSFILGWCLIGLSEIIELLQQNQNIQVQILNAVQNQKIIIEQKGTGTQEQPKTQTVLQDIESNLPKL